MLMEEMEQKQKKEIFVDTDGKIKERPHAKRAIFADMGGEMVELKDKTSNKINNGE